MLVCGASESEVMRDDRTYCSRGPGPDIKLNRVQYQYACDIYQSY
jgi:hypothetical protein